MTERSNRTAVLISAALWLVGTGAGFCFLSRYSIQPGAAARAPDDAPAHVREWLTPGRPLLILALHPQCPCSDASVAELSDALAWTPEAGDLVLLLYRPAGAPDSWISPAQYDSLLRFHPRLVIDQDGALADSIGARTSGHVVAYDGSGHLAFSGGLTAGRGQRGETGAQAVLRDLLRGRKPAVVTAPTYGCAIQDAPRSGGP